MIFYKKFSNLLKSFKKFIEKTPPFGKSFICLDDINNQGLIKKLRTQEELVKEEIHRKLLKSF